MKGYLISIVSFFITFTFVIAQSPESFSYQTILLDNNGDVIANQNVDVDVAILLGDENGTEIFSESHSITANENGLINIKVGSVEDLSIVNWEAGIYFLKVTVDGIVVETKELLSVPFAEYSKHAYMSDSLDYAKLSNNPDFANWDKNSNDDFNGHFNSLLMWSEKNGNLFYNKGKVGIKGTVPTNFKGEVLRINGAILYNGAATDTISGILFYDPAGNGSFRYFDNNGEMKVIGAGIITFNDPDPPEGDTVIFDDVEWKNRICLGNGGYPGYNFGENVFVLVNDTLRIYFFDTSISGSFPSNDWQMVINDLQNGGDNYFAIFDSTHQTTPFKIMAGTTDNALFLADNSNLGMGTNNPSEQIDVDGNVSATFLMGNGAELVGLTGASSEIENAGSTTIGADSDADNNGQIEFQTQGTTKLLIDNDGNLKIGFSEPASEFDASDKNAKFNSIEFEENIAINFIKFSLTTETNPGGTSLDYDVALKKTIIFDSAIGSLTITGFQNGIPGQKITIINKSATNQVSIPSGSTGTQKIINPGYLTYTLNQYESASYVLTEFYWYCQELVKAP